MVEDWNVGIGVYWDTVFKYNIPFFQRSNIPTFPYLYCRCPTELWH
jgi:hypothetical protein